MVGHIFHHRNNRNGTWDAICLRCYLTAVSGPDELYLSLLETNHRCKQEDLFVVPSNLRYIQLPEPPTSPK